MIRRRFVLCGMGKARGKPLRQVSAISILPRVDLWRRGNPKDRSGVQMNKKAPRFKEKNSWKSYLKRLKAIFNSGL